MSKCAAWYQKYVHLKACLARRYVPRAWGAVKMTSTPVPRNTNCAESKGYNPISLLSFMQKIMQKVLTRNIRAVIGVCPIYLYQSAYKVGSPQKPRCTMSLYIHQKQQKTGSYTWAFLDIEGASDSTSCHITKHAKWHGLGDTLAMDWLHAGWQKNSATLAAEQCRGLWPTAACSGAGCYPTALKPGCR